MDVILRLYYYAQCFFLEVGELWRSRLASRGTQVHGTVRAVYAERTGFTSEVQVVYTYQFQSKYFAGSTKRALIFGANKIKTRFPSGSTVTVYVDAEKPTQSYLPSGVGWVGSAAIGLPGVGALILFLWIIIKLALER